ncbi:phage tail tape measure protein [Psychrobacter sp. I-STPA6b]|uniref:phage tail tape measure protein n=1 Tax=Psychrobacter sp. I-STPA6b TaxID=2585718 RepID=UPI001D0C9470|nr:phage tail tape measure protein [Psychrobacter sp. I-STPA6b]
MDIASLVVEVTNRGLEATNRGLDNLSRRARSAESSVSSFNDKFSGLRNAALGMGAVLSGVLYTSINAATGFESAMADVKKVVDFESPQGLQDMRNDLLQLSKEIPISAEGLAQIAAAAGQSGIAANEITRFTESAAKMGTAFDISAEEAGQAMAEMRVAFGFTQDEVETLADKINYLGNTTPNAAAKLTTIVQRIGSLGKISGVSADQLAAMGASITSLEPEVVATGLKNMMINMTRGDAATKSMRAAWQDLGFTAEGVAKGMQEDSRAMIDAVLEAINKLPKDQQTSYINTLFGAEALPVVAQLATNTDALATNLNAMGDASKYAGSAQAEYQARSETTANQMELLKNNVNKASIAIGQALLPALNNIVEKVIPVVNAVGEWADKNPELVTQIVAVTGAVTGAILAISGIGLAVSGVLSAMQGFSAIFGVARTAVLALSNPIGLAVLAIGALVVAGVYLYQNWDEISAKAKEIWANISDAIGGTIYEIVEDFNGMIDSVNEWSANVVNSVKNAFSSMSDTASAMSSNVVDTVSDRWESLKTATQSVFESLPQPVQAGLGAIKDYVDIHLGLVKTLFSTAWNVIKSALRGDMEGVKSAISNGLAQAVSIVNEKAQAILQAFKSITGKMLQIGKDIVQGLVDGIKGGANRVIDAAKSLASAVPDWVKKVLDIHSPSRVTHKLGLHTAEGMAQGIRRGSRQVQTEAQRMAEQAVKSVTDAIATLKKEIALFGNDSLVASFDYDVSVGKFAGVPQSLLDTNRALLKQKEQMIALDKEQSELDRQREQEIARINQANKSVTNSIADLNKQIALFGNDSPLNSLIYDLQNTSKYADVSAKNIKKLTESTARLQALNEQQSINDAFSNLQGELFQQSPLEKLEFEYQNKLAIIDEFEQKFTDQKQKANDARLALDAEYAKKHQEILSVGYQNTFDTVTGLMGLFAGKQSATYKGMLIISKLYAQREALINSWVAISKAWASAPFPYNLPSVAIATAKTGIIPTIINSISPAIGQAHDGIMSVPKSGTWNLEKGERVLPKHTAKAMDKKLAESNGVSVNVEVKNYSSATVETQKDERGNIFMIIRDEVKRGFANLSNPNSFESKQVGRNFKAPRNR